jgi:predicted anti-sigma-YlaC factor YlaD
MGPWICKVESGGTLEAEELAVVSNHIKTCDSCRTYAIGGEYFVEEAEVRLEEILTPQ